MSRATPSSLQMALREGYLRYFDTAFWLRDHQMLEERRRLLAQPGVVFREPLIEALFPYEEGETIETICDRAGLPAGTADELARLVFGQDERGAWRDGSFRLRTHQAQALAISLAPLEAQRRNLVVTSGTGSGKTECFLLPIFARLLAESTEWTTPRPLRRWWSEPTAEHPWLPLRHAEPPDRAAAMRAV